MEIATIAAVPVAMLAWLLPDPFGFGGGQTSTGAATTTQPATQPSSPATPQSPSSNPGGGGAPTGTSSAPGRRLADLTPDVGGVNIDVPADHRTIQMPCNSGQSDDQYREVRYRLGGAYSRFSSRVQVFGVDERSLVQVTVTVDDNNQYNQTLRGSGSVDLPYSVADADALTLSVTCQHRGGTVVFIDPTLTS
jgi:hypothetical protein